MIAAIRSELRKILTLRSTYIILAFAFIIVVLMNGWATGYKHGPLDENFVSGIIRNTLQGMSFLLGIVVLLQVAHEYRYNTIYYTLTLTKRRTTVFLAKVIVATVAMLTGAIILIALGVVSGVIGVAASGAALGAQTIPWGDIVLKGSMYVWGVGMFALIITFLLRNQVGAIVMYLFGVNIAEQLLSLILKSNTGYLPFRALEGVIMQASVQSGYVFSPEKSMIIVTCWIAVAGFAAWILFLKRDAN